MNTIVMTNLSRGHWRGHGYPRDVNQVARRLGFEPHDLSASDTQYTTCLSGPNDLRDAGEQVVPSGKLT